MEKSKPENFDGFIKDARLRGEIFGVISNPDALSGYLDERQKAVSSRHGFNLVVSNPTVGLVAG